MAYTGNRGMSLEALIEFANNSYRLHGLGLISKQHTHFVPIRNHKGQIVNCKVDEKATVDFVGRIGSRPVAAEAKLTKQKRIRYQEVKHHQALFLDDFTKDEAAIGLVVISYNLDSFYAIPWPFWKAASDAWEKAIRYGEKKAEKVTVTFNGQSWTTNGMASVKEEELLPEWKVTIGGKIGLDYLARYITK